MHKIDLLLNRKFDVSIALPGNASPKLGITNQISKKFREKCLE